MSKQPKTRKELLANITPEKAPSAKKQSTEVNELKELIESNKELNKWMKKLPEYENYVVEKSADNKQALIESVTTQLRDIIGEFISGDALAASMFDEEGKAEFRGEGLYRQDPNRDTWGSTGGQDEARKFKYMKKLR